MASFDNTDSGYPERALALENEHLRQLWDTPFEGLDGARDGVLLVLQSIHGSDHKVQATQFKTEMTEKLVLKTWRSLRYC